MCTVPALPVSVALQQADCVALALGAFCNAGM